MPKLYTLLLDYEGGTYITQIPAITHGKALTAWIQQFHTHGVSGIDVGAITQFKNELREDELVPVDGCQNVWCISGLLKDKLALVNLVATCP